MCWGYLFWRRLIQLAYNAKQGSDSGICGGDDNFRDAAFAQAVGGNSRTSYWLSNNRTLLLCRLLAGMARKRQITRAAIRCLSGGNTGRRRRGCFYDNICDGSRAGKFRRYYTHYKARHRLKRFHDPHCFLLSIGTQYGIFGLAGFSVIILVAVVQDEFNGASGAEGQRRGEVCENGDDLRAYYFGCGIDGASVHFAEERGRDNR